MLLRKTQLAKITIDNIRIPYGNHTLKYPSHPQDSTSQYCNRKQSRYLQTWQPNPQGAKPKDVIELPTTCNGMREPPHPTQKPKVLFRKFVLASSDHGDLVIDPFSGSGTTLVVAEQLGRQWLGCDINSDYHQWAIRRIETAESRSDEE